MDASETFILLKHFFFSKFASLYYLKLLEEMKKNEVKPNGQTYVCLLNACAAAGRLDRVYAISYLLFLCPFSVSMSMLQIFKLLTTFMVLIDRVVLLGQL